jgi:predicted PurR-regulated permease PerM
MSATHEHKRLNNLSAEDAQHNAPGMLRPLALAAITALALYLCWKMLVPFISAFIWALALAVAVTPLRRWFFRRLRPLPATLLIMTIVIVVLAAPVTYLARELLQESLKAQSLLQKSVHGDWLGAIQANKWLGPLWLQADQQFDLSEMAQDLASTIARAVAPAVARSVGVISQTGAALLAFFFFVRDQEVILAAIRRLLPLEKAEAELLFTRVSSAVESAVYGRLFIGMVQGCLGGLVFGLVGLPARCSGAP